MSLGQRISSRLACLGYESFGGDLGGECRTDGNDEFLGIEYTDTDFGIDDRSDDCDSFLGDGGGRCDLAGGRPCVL